MAKSISGHPVSPGSRWSTCPHKSALERENICRAHKYMLRHKFMKQHCSYRYAKTSCSCSFFVPFNNITENNLTKFNDLWYPIGLFFPPRMHHIDSNIPELLCIYPLISSQTLSPKARKKGSQKELFSPVLNVWKVLWIRTSPNICSSFFNSTKLIISGIFLYLHSRQETEVTVLGIRSCSP